MPANRSLKVGLVGTGFMGRTHSNAYHQVRRFFPEEAGAELVAVCSRDEAKARDFAAQWGFSSHETDWRRLVERDDIDLIDIASPNDTHAEIALAAAASTAKWWRARSRSDAGSPRRGAWSRRWSAPTSPTWSGTTTGACRR